MNAELIKGIDTVINGLTLIKNALTADETVSKTFDKVVAEVAEPVTVTTETTPVVTAEPVKTSPKSNDFVGINGYSKEQIESMKYNEFKKFAAQLGVKCTGTRSEIMARIIALVPTDSVEEDVVTAEPVIDETPKKSEVTADADKKSNKLGASKRKVVDEAPELDEFDKQAREIADDTPIEDIIEALADVDIKATKKNAIEKLAHALREGLIEADEDEDSEEDLEEDEDIVEEDTADETEDEDEVEIEADSYFKQFDPDGYNDPDNMTEERHEAIVEKMDYILTDVSEENLTIEDIEKYIENHATDEEIELLGDDYTEDEQLMFYMELVKRTIDNDGEEHTEEEDPYEVGEHDMCCGHELKYVKKTKRYICEHCGTEYEA